MKIKTVILAIAAVLTLAQSAEANNKCKLLEIVQYVADDAAANTQRAVIKQVLDGYEASPVLMRKVERFKAVALFNSKYRKAVNCKDSSYQYFEYTRAEIEVGEETVIRLDKWLNN